MNAAKRIALYVCGAFMLFIWAVIVDAIAVFGSPAYAVPYPAARLCSSLKPGMELRDAEAIMYQLGRPQSAEFRSAQLRVFSSYSDCVLDIDSTTSRIVKITASDHVGVGIP
jgi:hypothetical protein